MLSTFARKVAIPLVPKCRRQGGIRHEKPFAGGRQAGRHNKVTD
jgi:hypothetical protein